MKDQNLNPDKTYIYLNGKKMNSVMIKKDGYYTIDVKTEDLAGNQNRCSRKFTVNQKGIQIHFLQEDLKEKQISTKNLKPGFRIESLEPVQVMAFLVNGQKKEYQWKEDKVYIKDPITENGECSVSLHVKDSAGNEKTSEEIQFFYDTQKPVIKIEGLDQKSECEYGKQISILLENKTDQWEKIILDGKEQKLEHHKITWKELAPGKHVLHLKAVDQAGNKTDQRITFKITKVLPKAVKQIVVKQDKIPSKKDEKNQKHPNLWLLFLIGTSIFVSVKMFCNVIGNLGILESFSFYVIIKVTYIVQSNGGMDIMAEEVKETREDFEAQLEESLNKASTNEDAVWNRLEQMKEDGDVLALTVGGVVNGGVIVYVEGIRGFIPASLLSTKYVEDLNVWLQKDVEAKIITVEPEEQRLVLSAKAVEKEKERKERENKINELKVGTVVEGTVENIMPYGAFVDIGDGISGLVHISQLSQKRVKSPEEVVKEGDAVTVKIIKVANGKVSLSIKALEDDKEAAKKAEETGVEYTEDAAGTSLGDLLANIKL